MTDSEKLHVSSTLQIPLSELRYRTARSGGPGGQYVNRTESQVELLWPVLQSPSLSKTQRYRIMQVLGNRIDREGVLHLTSSQRRSQLQNRRAVTERLLVLLREALKPRRKRVATKPSRAAVERRLQAKRRRSGLKRQRGKVFSED
jgi:ribosome-associated protein